MRFHLSVQAFENIAKKRHVSSFSPVFLALSCADDRRAKTYQKLCSVDSWKQTKNILLRFCWYENEYILQILKSVISNRVNFSIARQSPLMQDRLKPV